MESCHKNTLILSSARWVIAVLAIAGFVIHEGAVSADEGFYHAATTGSDGDVLCRSFVEEPGFYDPSFDRDGIVFESLDAAVDLFASDIGLSTGEIVLQFGDGGLLITLPVEATFIRLHAGSFDTDVQIEAVASDGTVQDRSKVVASNSVIDVTLTSSVTTISTVTLVGGGDDGFLADICVVVTGSVFGDVSCTSFIDEPDNTHYGWSFDRDDFVFESLDDPGDLFANDVAVRPSEVVLQFGDPGLLITLPLEAAAVRMRAGSFGTDVQIESFAADGTLQDRSRVVASNSVIDVTLIGSITTITLVGGDAKGFLADICAGDPAGIL